MLPPTVNSQMIPYTKQLFHFHQTSIFIFQRQFSTNLNSWFCFTLTDGLEYLQGGEFSNKSKLFLIYCCFFFEILCIRIFAIERKKSDKLEKF